MKHIFISYSHKDKAYTHKLSQYFFDHGFDVWIDDRIDYGSRWPTEIEKRIKECSAFILIMSPHSYESEWVQNELSFARKLGKPVYPLLLDGDAWWHLGTTQYVDIKNGELPPTKFFTSLAEVANQSSEKGDLPFSIHVNGNVQGNIVVGNNNNIDSSAPKTEKTTIGKPENKPTPPVQNKIIENDSKKQVAPSSKEVRQEKAQPNRNPYPLREQNQREPVKTGYIIFAGFVIVILVAIFLFTNYSPQIARPTSVATSTAGVQDSITGTKQWSAAPAMTIDKSKQYFATVKMAKGGQFVIQLYPDKAPITVNSFVFLARQGFFNGITFHRVLEGFMAQGGDPNGNGSGGPGYQFVNENSDLKFDKAGVVAMANAGRDTNGSQFFITFGPQPSLDDGYTIFGQVTEGMDVVNAITRRDPQENPSFTGDAMESVTITEK